MDTLLFFYLLEISIHALREEGDYHRGRSRGVYRISIHALREEGDWIFDGLKCTLKRFLSTPSARRATIVFDVGQQRRAFLSTPSARRATVDFDVLFAFQCDFYPRPPRGGRLSEEEQKQADEKISIHALREEGDPVALNVRLKASNFYPRPPRGGRQLLPVFPEQPIGFLSTPSARRATYRPVIPHPDRLISIHALREEGDDDIYARQYTVNDFYPRPPRGGRPGTGKHRRTSNPISIHALREEGDFRDSSTITEKGDFYPRPPRGGRRTTWMEQSDTEIFLSTPSARRATYPYEWSCTTHLFLSTPSARRATLCRFFIRLFFLQFLSTPSARRATLPVFHSALFSSISIHALREEGDSKNRDKISIFKQIIQHSARI